MTRTLLPTSYPSDGHSSTKRASAQPALCTITFRIAANSKSILLWSAVHFGQIPKGFNNAPNLPTPGFSDAPVSRSRIPTKYLMRPSSSRASYSPNSTLILAMAEVRRASGLCCIQRTAKSLIDVSNAPQRRTVAALCKSGNPDSTSERVASSIRALLRHVPSRI